MAPTAAAAAAVACLLLALAVAGAASSPAPAPAVDCAAAATSMADCVDYVSPGSTKKHPGKTCCAEVKTAVANPALVDCLCAALSSKDLPIPIDVKRVLALPAVCGASNTAFSKCHIAAGAPSAAAATSPSATAGPASGGATAAPPVPAAAASSPVTATALVAAVAAPLLAYLF